MADGFSNTLRGSKNPPLNNTNKLNKTAQIKQKTPKMCQIIAKNAVENSYKTRNIPKQFKRKKRSIKFVIY